MAGTSIERCLLDSFVVWTHSLEKRREAPNRQNQDWEAVEFGSGKIAISDGAAASGLSSLWSKILVSSFIDSDKDLFSQSFISLPTLTWPMIFQRSARYVSTFRRASWLSGSIMPIYEEVRHRWDEEIRARYPDPQRLGWLLQNELAEGSYATILFAQLKIDSSLKGASRVLCRAVAVGDTCIMKLNGFKVLESFPLTRPQEFDSRPDLVCTRYPPQSSIVKSAETLLRSGDILFLGSDSIAKWFLEDRQNRKKLLESVKTDGDINFLLEQEILSRRLTNDDITFAVVQI